MNSAAKQGVQDGASVAMASMDRSQVRAMQALHEVEQSLHSREVDLLRGYELKLARSEALERIFVGAVVFILVGMFWYGRKLQHTHEQMILDRERMLEERHARLAALSAKFAPPSLMESATRLRRSSVRPSWLSSSERWTRPPNCGSAMCWERADVWTGESLGCSTSPGLLPGRLTHTIFARLFNRQSMRWK